MKTKKDYIDIISLYNQHNSPLQVCSKNFYNKLITEKKYCKKIIKKAMSDIFDDCVHTIISDIKKEILFKPIYQNFHSKVLNFIYKNKDRLIIKVEEVQDLYELAIQKELEEILILFDKKTQYEIIKSALKKALGTEENLIIKKNGIIYLKQYVCLLERRAKKREAFSFKNFFNRSVDDTEVKEIFIDAAKRASRKVVNKINFASQIYFNKNFLKFVKKEIYLILKKEYENRNTEDYAFMTDFIFEEQLNVILETAVEMLFKNITKNKYDFSEKKGEEFLKWFDLNVGFDVSKKEYKYFTKPKIFIEKKEVNGVFVINTIKKMHNLLEKMNYSKKAINVTIIDIEEIDTKIEDKEIELENLLDEIKENEEKMKILQKISIDAKEKKRQKKDFHYLSSENEKKIVVYKESEKFIKTIEIKKKEQKVNLSDLKKKKRVLSTELNQTLIKKRKNKKLILENMNEEFKILNEELLAIKKEYDACVVGVAKALVEKIQYRAKKGY